jgi:hypothetical protein
MVGALFTDHPCDLLIVIAKDSCYMSMAHITQLEQVLDGGCLDGDCGSELEA